MLPHAYNHITADMALTLARVTHGIQVYIKMRTVVLFTTVPVTIWPELVRT